MNAQTAYWILLRLYPAEHRAMFAGEMLGVFEEAAAERRQRGWLVFAAFVLGELGGLVKGAAAQWLSNLSTRRLRREDKSSVSARQSGLPDEVFEAQMQVDLAVKRIVYAIAHHQFEKARIYSGEERRLREDLGVVRARHRIAS